MRNIILSVLGVLLIIGAFFIGQKISNSKKKERPIPEKVVKTVFTDTVNNGTVQIVGSYSESRNSFIMSLLNVLHCLTTKRVNIT